jgi:hypothetical protein
LIASYARKERLDQFRGAGSTAWRGISYKANSTLASRQDVSGKRLELSKRTTAQLRSNGHTKTNSSTEPRTLVCAPRFFDTIEKAPAQRVETHPQFPSKTGS